MITSMPIQADLQLKGRIICENHGFQLCPLPKNAYKICSDSGFMRHAPVVHERSPFIIVLQIDISSSGSGAEEFARITSIKRLLSLLLPQNIKPTSVQPPDSFFYMKTNDVITNYRLPLGFLLPPMDERIFFEECERKAPVYETKDGIEYYNYLWSRDEDEEIKVSEHFDKDVDHYFQLSNEDRKRFDTALYWFGTAIENSHNVSLMILACCTAIEALLDKSTDKCNLCHQPRYRVSKKFKDFLDEYCPMGDPKLKGKLADIYGARSKLIHGNEKPYELWDTEPRKKFMSLLVLIVARRSLVYWMRSRKE